MLDTIMVDIRYTILINSDLTSLVSSRMNLNEGKKFRCDIRATANHYICRRNNGARVSPRGSRALSAGMARQAITFYGRANIVGVTQSGRASQLSDRQFRHTQRRPVPVPGR